MNYLCFRKLQGIQQIESNQEKYKSLWNSKNIDNILAELKNGFLIELREEKGNKQDKNIIAAVNMHFFNMYQNIVQVIIDSIKPEF